VRDTGIGLSREHLEQIFSMFSQVESATDRAQGGLGIGLALSRGLVQLHRGSIEAASEGPGHGSQFTVCLPLPPRPAPAAASEQDSLQPRAPARKRRVLIADDNGDALMTMAALLEIEGHEVHTATDGEHALARAEAVHPDVAILDIGMPRLSGHEVAQRIRATPWGRDMQLIALTGWGQAQDQELARSAGFDHHCTKPVDLQMLLGLLAEKPARSAGS
jgi:CheY-like chemotaxis protein